MQPNKKVILFDIDYTLFDVGYFDEHFHRELSKIFIEDEESIRSKSMEIIVNLIKQESFLDIDKYLEILLSKFKKKRQRAKIEHLLFKTAFFKNGFYTEVEKSLRSLKDFARLGIFSQGDEKFQGAKINQSGFKEFFDKELIYIVKPRKLDILPLLRIKHKKDKVFLVEDKPLVVHTVKQNMPNVFTIWVKRGKYAEGQIEIENFKPDATVTSLDQIVSIVKKN